MMGITHDEGDIINPRFSLVGLFIFNTLLELSTVLLFLRALRRESRI